MPKENEVSPTYGSFHFTIEDIIWCIKNLAVLEEGDWPRDNPDSGYTDNPTRGKLKAEGYFVKPTSISGEIKLRLQIAGDDGLLARCHYQLGMSYEEIGKHKRLPAEIVESRIKAAISHCSGSKRKKYYDRQRWR